MTNATDLLRNAFLTLKQRETLAMWDHQGVPRRNPKHGGDDEYEADRRALEERRAAA